MKKTIHHHYCPSQTCRHEYQRSRPHLLLQTEIETIVFDCEFDVAYSRAASLSGFMHRRSFESMIPALLKRRSIVADEVLTASRNLAVCRRIGKEFAAFQTKRCCYVHSVIIMKGNSSKTNYKKNALYLTRFYVIRNPFENPHGLPTDPWGFIIVPIPIPHPYPWESPYPRQPWKI